MPHTMGSSNAGATRAHRTHKSKPTREKKTREKKEAKMPNNNNNNNMEFWYAYGCDVIYGVQTIVTSTK